MKLDVLGSPKQKGLFSNLKIGARVLNHVYSQLIIYYKRFEEIVKTKFKQIHPKVAKDFVPTTTITFEMRKYSLEFWCNKKKKKTKQNINKGSSSLSIFGGKRTEPCWKLAQVTI